MSEISKSELDRCGGGARRGALLWALAILASPVLIAPLLAPHIFNLLIGLGRRMPSLSALRSLEFESILTRTMLIAAVAVLWPALTLLRRNGFRILPRPDVRSLAGLGKGLSIGLATMAVVPVLGLVLGAYRFEVASVDIGFVASLAGFLAVGLLVGILEEYLFRGVIFGLIERSAGLWTGLLVSAAVYSLVHFLNPVLPTGVVHGHWYSGFQALAVAVRSFAQMGVHVFPYSLTLFLIGAALALIYHHTRNLFLVAGVHAGWIVVLKLSKESLGATGILSRFFGDDMVLSKSYAVALLALIFLLAETAGRLRQKIKAKDRG